MLAGGKVQYLRKPGHHQGLKSSPTGECGEKTSTSSDDKVRIGGCGKAREIRGSNWFHSGVQMETPREGSWRREINKSRSGRLPPHPWDENGKNGNQRA